MSLLQSKIELAVLNLEKSVKLLSLLCLFPMFFGCPDIRGYRRPSFRFTINTIEQSSQTVNPWFLSSCRTLRYSIFAFQSQFGHLLTSKEIGLTQIKHNLWKSVPPGNYRTFEKIHFFALHPVVAKIKVIVTVCVSRFMSLNNASVE